MKPKLEEVIAECGRFRTEFSTLLMATVSNEGQPDASYAPYIMDSDGAFYVYLSELAQHTGNLRERPITSVLFIEDEDKVSQLFARRRLTLRCESTHVPRRDTRWPEMLDRFRERFGEVVDILRDLEDFHLYRLEPLSATYVRGFAQAYELTGSDLQSIRHINDKGHRSGAGTVSAETTELADGG